MDLALNAPILIGWVGSLLTVVWYLRGQIDKIGTDVRVLEARFDGMRESVMRIERMVEDLHQKSNCDCNPRE